jgi:hypothetical protein
MMDGLMDRKILPQDRPDKGVGLIAIIALVALSVANGLGTERGYTPISLSSTPCDLCQSYFDQAIDAALGRSALGAARSPGSHGG